MLLAPAVIVFVGIAGKHPEKIQHQLAPVLAHVHVAQRTVAARDLGDLARHTDASRDVVQHLHVDGVVGGALIESGGALTLRVVIYDGEGNLTSLGETPLGGHTMSKDELEVLGENLEQDLGGVVAHRKAEPAAEPPPEVALPKPAPKPSAVAVAPKKSAPPPTSDLAEISFDAPEEPPHLDAAPTETADAVSLDDVAALNNGSDSDTSSGESTAAPATTSSDLHLHANAGLGVTGRSFSGPSTLMGYGSSPVGTVHVAAGISPVAHLALEAMAEEALGMTTSVGKNEAPTSMSRWEITAAYTITRGSLAIAPTIGIGQRDFSIDSNATGLSPNTSYGYFLIGATAALPLGQRFTLHGLAAFEPVTGGDEPTAMEFGSATRWALDVGAGLDVKVFSHVSARAAFDYQQFSWGWSAAGTRSAASATDIYPTGTLSLGAEY